MKNFQDTRFISAFHRVLNATRPAPLAVQWATAGVAWKWERHSFIGQSYALNTEVHRLAFEGAKPWVLMVVFETWRAESDDTPIHQTSWSKLIEGQRADVLNWFRRQEAKTLP